MLKGIKIYLKEIVFAVRDVRKVANMINDNLCTNNQLQRDILEKLEDIKCGIIDIEEKVEK